MSMNLLRACNKVSRNCRSVIRYLVQLLDKIENLAFLVVRTGEISQIKVERSR